MNRGCARGSFRGLAALFLYGSALGQTFTVLYTFKGAPDGKTPLGGGVVLDPGGKPLWQDVSGRKFRRCSRICLATGYDADFNRHVYKPASLEPREFSGNCCIDLWLYVARNACEQRMT